MGEKDDGLGLSLSLKYAKKSLNLQPPPQHFHLNPMHAPLHLLHSADTFPRSIILVDKNGENRAFLRGFDVNQEPITTIECDDEEVIVSSPDSSTVSTVSGKRCESREENAAERGGASSSFEDDGGEADRKKLWFLKKFSKITTPSIGEKFRKITSSNEKQKLALAKQLNLRPRQVEVWFQNRRARIKLKQTEIDCEYLRRYCENLTEENRRLQKEVNELRTLKLSPQFYTNMNPPTTLTMCPQCERVNGRSSSSSSAASTSLTLAPGVGSIRTNRQQQPGTTHYQPPMAATQCASIYDLSQSRPITFGRNGPQLNSSSQVTQWEVFV